jgi:hypothetical protein
MMAKKINIPIDVTDDQQLCAEIERLTDLKWLLMVERNVSKANKISDQLFELERHIPGLPDKGRRILMKLAGSPQEELRQVAGWHLIPINLKIARKILADLTKNASNVHIKITSRVTLEELNAGRVDYYGSMNLSPNGKRLEGDTR